MQQTWRWFSPDDGMGIDDMLQAGVEGVVSAQHDVPLGLVWTCRRTGRRSVPGRWARGVTRICPA